MRRILNTCLTLLLLAFALFFSIALFSPRAYAYTITETQLQSLEMGLNKLQSNNEWYRKELIEQQKSQKKLLEKSKSLQATLANSQNDLKKMQQLLDNANQSLAKYEKQIKEEKARIKRERTIAIIIATGLAYALIRK